MQFQCDFFQQFGFAEGISIKDQVVGPYAQSTGKIHKDRETELGVSCFDVAHMNG